MTKEKLKTEIRDILENLKKVGKNNLAKCIEENWDKSAMAYSKELNSWKPERPMEKELVLACKKELERLGTTGDLKDKILDSLKRRRILQTAPHLVATEGPRMFCINWLGSLGVKPEDFYVIGMFSGIPFSNSFRPGRINKKDSPINLFPSSMQDGLVYRSIIPDKLTESIKDLSPQISKLLPRAIVGESYTKWALGACQNIERKLLKNNNLVFLDINEVVSEYLTEVLKNKNHIFYQIFFDSKTRSEFINIYPNETIFFYPNLEGKYEKMENMIFSGETLKGKNKKISLSNPEILIEELNHNRICPALILSFLAIAFLNQFKCFGSFYQVEYLPKYQQKFSGLEIMNSSEIKKVPTANLTTGVFSKNYDLYPVDILLLKKEFESNANILFGELLLPVREKLIKVRH